MTFVGARQTDAGRLAALWRAGVTGIQSLPLHIALRERERERCLVTWSPEVCTTRKDLFQSR